MSKKSLFGSVYGILIIVLLAVILVTWIILTLFLKAYEESQPEYAVTQYCSEMTPEHANELCQSLLSSLSPLQDQSQVTNYLQDAVLNATSVKSTRESDSTSNVYYLHDGTSYFEKLTLTPGETLSFGFQKWAVTGEELLLSSKAQNYSIKVPSDYSVTVNNQLLNQSYVVNKKTEYSLLSEFYGSKYDLPYLWEYETGPIFGDYSFYATDASGAEVPREQLTEETFEDNCSDSVKKELDEFCLEYIPAYVNFLSNANRDTDGNFWYLIGFVEEKSTLYYRLRDAKKSNGFNSSLGDEITDIVISKHMDCDSGYYVCDISFKYVATGQQKTKTELTTSIKLMIHSTSEGYKAVDMAQH